jgi:hypothetical protein
MDNIWRKAAKKIREQERCVTATPTPIVVQPEVKPTLATANTIIPAPTYMHPIASSNTVEQLDIRLLAMEQNWAQTRTGPFPEKLRNMVGDLRDALAIREEETMREADALIQTSEEAGDILER